jgi:6-phosphogluconolactonase
LGFFTSCLSQTNNVLFVATQGDDDIYVYSVHGGTLLQRFSVSPGLNPSWMDFSAATNTLYVTNEQTAFVSSLGYSPQTNRLTYNNRVATNGGSPNYISLSPNGNFVLTANYAGGSISVISIVSNGQVGKVVNEYYHNGTGPVPGRQTGPHPRQIIFHKNKFVYSPDLGSDRVYQYTFTPSTGVLTSLDEPYVSSNPGDGPRHLTFHPNASYAYLACELQSVIIVYQVGENGYLTQLQRVPSLFQPVTTNYIGEIVVHPNGEYLYASNCGNNSISIFLINSTNGEIVLLDVVSVFGAIPISLVMDPDTDILYAINKNSGFITAHQAGKKGELSFIGTTASGLEQPVAGKLISSTVK